MAMTGEVHWHEGLFLQPHHLQTMQRYFLERLSLERRLAWPYPYGLVESRISQDALENLLVKFDKLLLVMPSGLVVSVPDNADLPTLDIKEAFETSREPFVIYLGVPLWFAERANVLDAQSDWRVKRLYRTGEAERPDENTGENPQPIPVRRVNARLMLKNEDPSDLELIPLLRITHAAGDEVGLPRQDAHFVPPCLTLNGSSILRDLVRDLANQVEASRKELVAVINRSGLAFESIKGLQFEQLLRLRTLNHFGGRLIAMAEAPAITPFDAYVELRGLLGELAALYPNRDQYEVAKYDHDNPAVSFFELANRIRTLLKGIKGIQPIKVPLVAEELLGEPIHAAALTDEHVTRPNEYFLAVESREESDAVARLVENRDEFKLMARSLARKAIFGVPLKLERFPPQEFPARQGTHYFRLLRSETRMWERVVEEKAISAVWPGMETSDFKLTLFMTVPYTEGKV